VVDESVTTDAVTFQTGAVYALSNHLSATFNVSRGFRAPNSADLGGIGLSGGGGFGITPSRAADLGGLIGSTAGTDAVSTGTPIPALSAESLYAFEPGLRLTTDRVTASIALFDLEYLDTVQRRAIVFPAGIVGTTISGYQVVRQDANGLAYIAQDIRPIGTAVNLDRSRIRGFEADGTVRLAANWTALGYFSMSEGRLRWSRGGTWIEGSMTFARAQTKLNSGDLTDARTGAARTRNSIASYFNGTAVDLGLVKSGVLVQTGETLAQVQNRLMGTAATTYLYTDGPGFVTVGARAGFRLLPQLDLTIIGENLTDRNYRVYGSGVDAPGANITVRTSYRF
ncbi:MAG: TonB-dependent receptor, partial [Vicinamibacterales bacterium]